MQKISTAVASIVVLIALYFTLFWGYEALRILTSVGPASWTHSTDLMREHTYQLLFAALATGLCIYERSFVQRAADPKPELATDAPPTQAAPRTRI